jgi:hypothetical protein
MNGSTGRRASAFEGCEELALEFRTVGEGLGKAARGLVSTADPQVALVALRRLEELTNRLATSRDALAAAVSRIERLADVAFAELDADLRDALQEREWRCDGQWPTLFVERGIEIVIDEKGRSATVGGRKAASASVVSIIEALAPLVIGLLPKGFDPEQFVEELASAFDSVRNAGSTAPILDVYREYVVAQQKPRFWRNASKENFSGVSAEQFRARLTKTLETGRFVTRNRRALRLLPPLDPKDGLFVYQPAEQRFAFVGRIEFVSEA